MVRWGKTVKNYFRKAGWEKSDDAERVRAGDDDEGDEDEDSIPLSILRERLQFPETMTFEDYVGVDDAVQTDEALTESDILAELRSTDVDEEEEEDNPDDLEPEERICSLADAKMYLQEVRRFFESRQQTTDIDFTSICKLESALIKNIATKQTTIGDFF